MDTTIWSQTYQILASAGSQHESQHGGAGGDHQSQMDDDTIRCQYRPVSTKIEQYKRIE